MNRINPISSTKGQKNADHYEQGRLFEEYVKNLFNEKSFKLKRWRKSTFIPPDTFVSDISYPDLELIFARTSHYPFAVECKWRKRFYKGKIEWAQEKKIQVYKQFQKEKGMIVFIAIGIGGEPSNPEKLFVTPLDNICMHTEVYESDLLKYHRKPTRRFFYDTVQLRLW